MRIRKSHEQQKNGYDQRRSVSEIASAIPNGIRHERNRERTDKSRATLREKCTELEVNARGCERLK